MIDSVGIYLEKHQFRVVDASAFMAGAEPNGGGWRRYQNCPRKRKKRFTSKPSLTWSYMHVNGEMRERLRIEVSLTKLMFGDSVQELTDLDLPSVSQTLTDVLAQMGVETTPMAIATATVSLWHVSRNVVLPSSTNCSETLRDVERMRHTARWRFSRSDYEGGGAKCGLSTSQWELRFYDKNCEVASQRGAVMPVLQDVPPDARIIRIEMALNTREAIEKWLQRAECGISNPMLCDIFTVEVMQVVLLTLLSGLDEPLGIAVTPIELFNRFLKSGIGFAQALKMVGLALLEASAGTDEIRRVLKEYGLQDRWYRLGDHRAAMGVEKTGSSTLEVLRNAIRDYRPLRSVRGCGVYTSKITDKTSCNTQPAPPGGLSHEA